MPELRSSSRLKNKANSANATQGSPSNSTSTSKHSSSKRRKVTEPPNASNAASKVKAKGRGRGRGTLIKIKLNLITEMPLDILFEIFSFLPPADLLRLSRANKVFRDMLFDQKTNHVWKVAYMNIEQDQPPEMPEDMTYPQYTSLLYGTNCNYCGQEKTSNVHWAARLRLCFPCIKKKTISALHGTREKLPNLCPPWSISTPTNYYSVLYMKEDYVRITNELERLTDQKDLLKTFIQTQEKFYYERMKHARQCEKWIRDIKIRRDNEIRDIRVKRQDAICERLRQEGWGLELDYLDTWGVSKIPEVDKAQELTDKIWSKIHPGIITFLENTRVERLEKERKQLVQKRMMLFLPLYKKYLGTLKHSSHVPGFPDLCGEEPFRSLIFSTPTETTLTTADFEAHKGDIAEAFKAQAASQTRVLEALLPSEYPSLDLAMTWFCCRWCGNSISYPDILRHRCTNAPHKVNGDDAELYNYALHERPWGYRGPIEDEALFQRPWNSGGCQVKYDEEAAMHAKEIIEICGADPRNVSKKEMNDLDVRVECLRCGQGRRGRTGRLAMRWWTAVMHEVEKHVDNEEDLDWDGPRWQLLNAEDVELAKSKELQAHLAYPVRLPRE